MEQELRAFRRIVEFSWPELMSVTRDEWDKEELLNEWLEVNWELIVEGGLQFDYPDIVLGHYGEGTDNPNSRVFKLEADVTHFVCCRPNKGNTLTELMVGKRVDFPAKGLALAAFVSCEPRQCYRLEPPFNSVLVYEIDDQGVRVLSDYPLVFPLDEVSFVLTEAETPPGR